MNDPVSIRQSVRYRHTYLTMKVHFQMEWIWIKTFDWNESGFNFYFNESLQVAEHVRFKKGARKFQGEILWKRQKPTQKEAVEIALNQMLFEQLELFSEDQRKDLQEDLSKLARQKGMIDQKIAYLAENFHLKATEEIIHARIRESQTIDFAQYGVKVDDMIWKEIVKEAFGFSAVGI